MTAPTTLTDQQLLEMAQARNNPRDRAVAAELLSARKALRESREIIKERCWGKFQDQGDRMCAKIDAAIRREAKP